MCAKVCVCVLRCVCVLYSTDSLCFVNDAQVWPARNGLSKGQGGESAQA